MRKISTSAMNWTMKMGLIPSAISNPPKWSIMYARMKGEATPATAVAILWMDSPETRSTSVMESTSMIS
jgi:hypothetical protein